MHWSELNFYGEYEYLPLWTGFLLAIVGALLALGTVVLAVWTGINKSMMIGIQVGFVGLVIAEIMMFAGMFMDDTGFLLDTSWRKEVEELEYSG